MEDTKKPKLWAAKYPIVKESDTNELDRDAAALELGAERLPRSVAESRAYESYKRKEHMAASKYHFKGLQIARASGNSDAVTAHGRALYMHLRSLGDEKGLADKIRTESAEDMSNDGIYKFKSHASDDLLTDVLDKSEAKEYLRSAILGVLKGLQK